MNMPEFGQVPVLVRLPGGLVDDGLLDDVPLAWRVPDHRGPFLSDAVTVVSDMVGIGSGLVTIGVAHDQIAALARRVVGLLRRRHEAASPQSGVLAIEVRLPGGKVRVILVAEDDEGARELEGILKQPNG